MLWRLNYHFPIISKKSKVLEQVRADINYFFKKRETCTKQGKDFRYRNTRLQKSSFLFNLSPVQCQLLESVPMSAIKDLIYANEWSVLVILKCKCKTYIYVFLYKHIDMLKAQADFPLTFLLRNQSPAQPDFSLLQEAG